VIRVIVTGATTIIRVVRTITIITIMRTLTRIWFGAPAVSRYGSNYVNNPNRRFL
jgi:hypothetical protein